MCFETKTDLFNPDICFRINMMLWQRIRAKAEWLAFFIKADISLLAESDTYATTFNNIEQNW